MWRLAVEPDEGKRHVTQFVEADGTALVPRVDPSGRGSRRRSARRSRGTAPSAGGGSTSTVGSCRSTSCGGVGSTSGSPSGPIGSGVRAEHPRRGRGRGRRTASSWSSWTVRSVLVDGGSTVAVVGRGRRRRGAGTTSRTPPSPGTTATRAADSRASPTHPGASARRHAPRIRTSGGQGSATPRGAELAPGLVERLGQHPGLGDRRS